MRILLAEFGRAANLSATHYPPPLSLAPSPLAAAPPPPSSQSPFPVTTQPQWSPPLSSGQAILYAIVVTAVILIALCLTIRALFLRATGRLPRLPQGPLAQPPQGPDGTPLPLTTLGQGFYGHVGLPQAIVATFPVFPYEEKAGGGAGEGSCVVCLDEYRAGDQLRRLPGCEHAFHQACIDAWFGSHDTCPVCRVSLQPKQTAGGGAGGAPPGPEEACADPSADPSDGSAAAAPEAHLAAPMAAWSLPPIQEHPEEGASVHSGELVASSSGAAVQQPGGGALGAGRIGL